MRIDVAAIERVRERCGADLYRLAAGGLGGLLADPLALADVLDAIRPGPPLAGDALAAAGGDFVEGLARFFPEPSGERKAAGPVDVERLVWRLAGAVGLDPRPFTLRELDLMADGRSEADWGPVSHVLCVLANKDRDPKRTPFKPSDFNPHAKRERRAVVETVKLRDVKHLLMGMATRRKG